MGYSIMVSSNSLNNTVFFEQNFETREEYQAVANLCENKRRIGLFESLVIPVRTDTIRNFCVDFFFPTLINHALKINDISLKIICSLSFIVWDIIMLPIRLITVIPRLIYNAKYTKATHPFYQYLIQNGVDPAHLSEDSIYLERTEESNEGRRYSITSGDTFNFIQLPGIISIRNELQRIRGN